MINLNPITAIAHPNIAFIKYWGNRDHDLRIPSNGSISMNLTGLVTKTTIKMQPELNKDIFILNGVAQEGGALKRVKDFLDHLRDISQKKYFTQVESSNNYPASTGLASSAAAFAALALAGSKAFGLDFSENQLTRLARLGSGSAARSIPDGFVEWTAGLSNLDSVAFCIAPAEHWNLWDCIVIVENSAKQIGSTEGHLLAETSPLQKTRVADASRRLEICRSAIINKDFAALAEIIELDSHMLHAVMLTSRPSLMYWNGTSVSIMKEVISWRKNGIPAAFTLDAGPNVHIICTEDYVELVKERLINIPGVIDLMVSSVGEGARIIS